MMKSVILTSTLCALQAAAFPAMLAEMAFDELARRQTTTPAQVVSAARTNCGPSPCLVFDPVEQKVSTTGQYAYASPLPNQIRGPCPGLNAAANHGYIPRSGVLGISDTIIGLGSMFGMSPDLAGFLAAYAIIFEGDPITQTWSIGGPPPFPDNTGVLGAAPGISYSHNNYEGDSSIARNDAYINHGDAHSLNVSRFQNAYQTAQNDRYTLDIFARNFQSKADQSVRENPYYFAAPFSTTLVSPAAYNFVINFMSNHSASEPSGYLNGDMFKTWFAVTGKPGNFKWQRGQERIPDQWYRRTSTNQYTAAAAIADVAIQFAAYPDSLRLGGNTNGVNTYKGLDIYSLTSGAYTNADLTNPQNTTGSACFYEQFIQVILPDSALSGVSTALETAIGNLYGKYIKGFAGATGCKPITQYNKAAFAAYAGSNYNPKGTAQNYRA